MTEAEELELLELEALEAQANARQSASPPATDAEPGRLEALARGAGQGVSFGLGDEIWGGLRAVGDALPESMGGARARGNAWEDLVANYRRNRDEVRRANARAEASHGGYYLGGNVLGGVATTPFMPGAGASTAGKTLLSLMKSGAKTGAGVGALTGFGSSDADLSRPDLEQAKRAAIDTGVGAGVGVTLGGALPAAGAGLKRGVQYVRGLRNGGYVKPTPEAERLAAEGVDLTLGQMDPSAPIGRFEEVAANSATGGRLGKVRQGSEASARDVLLRKAGMPNAPAPRSGAPVREQISDVAAGFSKAYDDVLEGQHLQPEAYLGQGKWRGLVADDSLQGAAKTRGAFELAAASKDIDASPAVRERALAWLTEKAQALAPVKTGPNAGMVEAKSIQALRTQLRDRIRGLGKEGDDRQLREIYGRANEFVTELLEGQLPPEQAALLRTTDARYKNLLALQKAAERANRSEGQFTPGQLLDASAKRGLTPDLDRSTRDAYAVLNPTYPKTGALPGAVDVLKRTKYLGPLWASLANSSPALRAHALGQGRLPLPIQAPMLFTEGAGQGLELMSREPSRAALIRALAQARTAGLPQGSLAEE